MLAHVGRGGQGPPQLVGLVGQGATQDVAGGPGPLLLCHAPAQQGHLLLPLEPRLAQEVLCLPLLLLQLLRESLNFLRGRFKSATDLTVVPEKTLRKTLKSPLDCKEIHPVHPKRNQP